MGDHAGHEENALQKARQESTRVAAKYKLVTGKPISPYLQRDLVNARNTKAAMDLLNLLERGQSFTWSCRKKKMA